VNLTGLHLLLTFQCLFECDHCFVWGSPRQSGVMSLERIGRILEQARVVEGLEWIYFEGGEPFLYYPVLLRGVREAAAAGFRVGLVSNAYWAISVEDALEWLGPLAGLVQDLSVSCDFYHGQDESAGLARNAARAAESLGIPCDSIRLAQVGAPSDPDLGRVMFRGRAAVKLAGRTEMKPWAQFEACPHEDLAEPGRLHLDPLGWLHVCQGITLGNVLEESLEKICRAYRPEAHPIVGPLLAGGPAELVRRYGLEHAEAYADACHLCYQARLALREKFPRILGPDQMYGADL